MSRFTVSGLSQYNGADEENRTYYLWQGEYRKKSPEEIINAQNDFVLPEARFQNHLLNGSPLKDGDAEKLLRLAVCTRFGWCGFEVDHDRASFIVNYLNENYLLSDEKDIEKLSAMYTSYENAVFATPAKYPAGIAKVKKIEVVKPQERRNTLGVIGGGLMNMARRASGTFGRSREVTASKMDPDALLLEEARLEEQRKKHGPAITHNTHEEALAKARQQQASQGAAAASAGDEQLYAFTDDDKRRQTELGHYAVASSGMSRANDDIYDLPQASSSASAKNVLTDEEMREFRGITITAVEEQKLYAPIRRGRDYVAGDDRSRSPSPPPRPAKPAHLAGDVAPPRPAKPGHLRGAPLQSDAAYDSFAQKDDEIMGVFGGQPPKAPPKRPTSKKPTVGNPFFREPDPNDSAQERSATSSPNTGSAESGVKLQKEDENDRGGKSGQ